MSWLVPLTRTQVAPWPGLRELEDRLSDVFNGYSAPTGWAPAIDVHEDENAYTLVADVPGLKKEEIELTVEDDVVTLKGARKQEEEKKTKGYHRIERSYGTFKRSFRLPSGIDGNNVTAAYENGVLTVTLAKPEQAKPKRIDVNVN